MNRPQPIRDVTDRQPDLALLRRALGRFSTGVSIITTRTETGKRVGVTLNSFGSLSLEPALVIWSLQRTSTSFDHFMISQFFLVNVLGVDQLDLSRRFAISSNDKFEGIEHEVGLGDCPAFAASLAHFECRTTARIDGGDHVLFIGAVERFASREGEPLIFSSGQYCRPAPLQAVA